MPRYYIKQVIYLTGDKEMEAYANYCKDRWNRDILDRTEAMNFFNSHPKAIVVKKYDNEEHKYYYTVDWRK